MPTKRKPTPKPNSDVRPETLTRFSADLDQHAGHDVGFETLVKGLAVTRAQIGQLTTARAAVHDEVKRRYAAGARVVGGGSEYVLKQTDPGEPVQYLAVSSAAAKKADAAAWRRAQVAAPFVQAKSPVVAAAAKPCGTPTVDENTSLAELAAAYKTHPAWAVLKQLREIERETVERLDKLGADFGWDGLPITFADGWTVSLRRMQFSSEHLEATSPELFETLAEVKLRQQSPRVYIGTVDAEDEVDEIDGE